MLKHFMGKEMTQLKSAFNNFIFSSTVLTNTVVPGLARWPFEVKSVSLNRAPSFAFARIDVGTFSRRVYSSFVKEAIASLSCLSSPRASR